MSARCTVCGFRHDHGTECLTSITGLGRQKAESLHDAGFESAEDVRGATLDALVTVDGVGPALAARIKAYVGADISDARCTKACQSGQGPRPTAEPDDGLVVELMPTETWSGVDSWVARTGSQEGVGATKADALRSLACALEREGR